MVIKVYTSRACGNPRMKKEQEYITRMLYIQNIEYEEIDVGDPRRIKDKTIMQKKLNLNEAELIALPPQIFNGDEPVGEFDDFFSAVEGNNTFGFLRLPDDYVNKNPPREYGQPFCFTKEEAEEILLYRKRANRQKKKKKAMKALPEDALVNDDDQEYIKKEGPIQNTPAFQAMSRKLSISNESITSVGKLKNSPSMESIGKLKNSPSVESLGKKFIESPIIEQSAPTTNPETNGIIETVDKISVVSNETSPPIPDKKTDISSDQADAKTILLASTEAVLEESVHQPEEHPAEAPPHDSRHHEIHPPVESVEESVSESWTVVEESTPNVAENKEEIELKSEYKHEELEIKSDENIVDITPENSINNMSQPALDDPISPPISDVDNHVPHEELQPLSDEINKNEEESNVPTNEIYDVSAPIEELQPLSDEINKIEEESNVTNEICEVSAPVENVGLDCPEEVVPIDADMSLNKDTSLSIASEFSELTGDTVVSQTIENLAEPASDEVIEADQAANASPTENKNVTTQLNDDVKEVVQDQVIDDMSIAESAAEEHNTDGMEKVIDATPEDSPEIPADISNDQITNLAASNDAQSAMEGVEESHESQEVISTPEEPKTEASVPTEVSQVNSALPETEIENEDSTPSQSEELAASVDVTKEAEPITQSVEPEPEENNTKTEEISATPQLEEAHLEEQVASAEVKEEAADSSAEAVEPEPEANDTKISEEISATPQPDEEHVEEPVIPEEMEGNVQEPSAESAEPTPDPQSAADSVIKDGNSEVKGYYEEPALLEESKEGPHAENDGVVISPELNEPIPDTGSEVQVTEETPAAITSEPISDDNKANEKVDQITDSSSITSSSSTTASTFSSSEASEVIAAKESGKGEGTINEESEVIGNKAVVDQKEDGGS